MESIPRFFVPPEQSFFLFGPRGTGKSTWLREAFPGALWLDLLDSGRFRELSARPERLLDLVLAAPAGSVVVVDEVQRVPELLNGVHDLLERKLGYRFVLTGSSARKLRHGGVNLLAGRAVQRALHPFMVAELPGFELESALRIGLVPLILAAADPEDALAAYVSLYLQEEVQAEGLTRNVGNFARFLETVSFSHAAVLNVSEVAREGQIERKTVAAYLEILEDLLLAFRLPVFTRRARRATAVHPKLFYFDAGIFRTLRPRGPLDRPEEIEGAALEGLVAQHLRAWISYSGKDAELFFWQTRGGAEVDFVVYGEAGFWALEVKNNGTVRSQDLRGLKSFRDDYPECRPALLYRGRDRLQIDGILCLPVSEFLQQLHPKRRILEADGE